jgi:hypothetical protein
MGLRNCCGTVRKVESSFAGAYSGEEEASHRTSTKRSVHWTGTWMAADDDVGFITALNNPEGRTQTKVWTAYIISLPICVGKSSRVGNVEVEDRGYGWVRAVSTYFFLRTHSHHSSQSILYTTLPVSFVRWFVSLLLFLVHSSEHPPPPPHRHRPSVPTCQEEEDAFCARVCV